MPQDDHAGPLHADEKSNAMNLNTEPQHEGIGRRFEANTAASAAQPVTEEPDPQHSPSRASGRGEVRSEHDRRLQDNLTPQQRSEIGRKGGESVSRNREHMAAIGRKGGQTVSQNREHMATIGREGGKA